MNERKLFLIATRAKYRYAYKGMLSTEDLWDLSLDDLNNLFMKLKSEVKHNEQEDSLLVQTTVDQKLLDKIAIVKSIFEVKEAEANAKLLALAKREESQRIMEIIKRKEDAALEDTDIEALKARLSELQ